MLRAALLLFHLAAGSRDQSVIGALWRREPVRIAGDQCGEARDIEPVLGEIAVEPRLFSIILGA